MKIELSSYIMRSDGIICDLPMTEELVATLHSLGQDAKSREDGAERGTVWEFMQVLRQAMSLRTRRARS